MSQSARLIASSFEKWGLVPHVVRDVFSDATPDGVASAIDELCRRALGSGVRRAEFFEASVGSVHGLRLHDGRRVVVKLHGPRVTPRFVEAVFTVQRHLSDAGFPAPRPLLAPLPFRHGLAAVEELVDGGDRADAHRPQVRRAMAGQLAALVALTRRFTGVPGLAEHTMEVPSGALWPYPHDGRFDFEATSIGAAWIDRVAAHAQAVCNRPVGDVVVGHTDWRVQNMRFADDAVTVVYDWDSLRLVREPLLVGSVAHAFTTDWSAEDWQQFPTCAEALAFVTDYERARGAPFTDAEAATARAALVYTMAYTARCEHSDALTDMGRQPPPTSATPRAPAGTARAFLAEHAASLLVT